MLPALPDKKRYCFSLLINSLNLSSLFGQDDYILASFFLLFFLPFLSEGLKGLWEMCGVELHCKLECMVQNET